MVAVRSAHINKAGEFDPEKWIASLGITSQKSCECLAETWAYCLQQTQGHPDASLLLWRGVEMVEILSTLSMDIDTLRAALLSVGVTGGPSLSKSLQILSLFHIVKRFFSKSKHYNVFCANPVVNIAKFRPGFSFKNSQPKELTFCRPCL